MAEQEQPRPRGLPSIEEVRKGRGRMRWPSAKFWGYAGLILAVALIFEYKSSQGENEHARQKLLSQQRAMKAELGPKWFPLRDEVEQWTLGLAKDAGTEVIDKSVLADWDFRSKPGIYLRMRAAEVASNEAIRKGAKESLRDAFTTCLVTYPNPVATAGMECKHTRQCPLGESCNESDHCSKAAQPFNLRVAYRTMHVLSDEWVTDVQEASTDIRLRLFDAQFDDSLHDDVPLATDLLTRAQYFLLVLDEDTKAAVEVPDAGSQAEALFGVAHPSRVAVWRLSDKRLVLRLRREAGGELMGGEPPGDEQVLAARRRQANSCALALAVRQAVGDSNVPVVPPTVP